KSSRWTIQAKPRIATPAPASDHQPRYARLLGWTLTPSPPGGRPTRSSTASLHQVFDQGGDRENKGDPRTGFAGLGMDGQVHDVISTRGIATAFQASPGSAGCQELPPSQRAEFREHVLSIEYLGDSRRQHNLYSMYPMSDAPVG